MVKKFLAIAVISLVALPAPHAFALTTMHGAFEEIVQNVVTADSVDFNMSVDMTTTSEDFDQPSEMHVDIDGAVDNAHNAAFESVYWFMDEHGTYRESNGAIVLAPGTFYMSKNGDDWYYFSHTASNSSSDEDAAALIETLTANMQIALDNGIMTFEADGTDVIDGTAVARYTFEVHDDLLLQYLIEEGIVTDEDAREAFAEVAESVTMSGSVWIDTAAMLPVMLTLNVHVVESETSHTAIEFSILFESFNERVDIDVPTHAVSFSEYRANETDTLIMSSIEGTLSQVETARDTDGDGLTDDDEVSTWGSSPLNTDTDADGYVDYTEVVHGYNPNGSGKLDSDNDGLTDYNEMTIHWTDRFDADSDNDGYNDGLEIANGYDPNGPGRW